MKLPRIMRFDSPSTGTISKIIFFLLLSVTSAFQLKSMPASTQEDYLTADEVEQLRDAQEPPLRMNLLGKFLFRRFETIRLSASNLNTTKGEAHELDRLEGNANEKEGESKSAAAGSNATKKKESQETIGQNLKAYLSCLDEISDNIENSHAIPLDPKAFMKSLNKLDESLQKQIQWFNTFDTKTLERRDKETTEDIIQTQRDLAEDLDRTRDELKDQIKEMKDAKKAESKKN